jgi:hypothetical protein
MTVNRINVSILPKKEQNIYEQIKFLPKQEKERLWELIKQANRDGIVLLSKEDRITISLTEKGLIRRNPLYLGKKMSYFILPKAPHLNQQLKQLRH